MVPAEPTTDPTPDVPEPRPAEAQTVPLGSRHLPPESADPPPPASAEPMNHTPAPARAAPPPVPPRPRARTTQLAPMAILLPPDNAAPAGTPMGLPVPDPLSPLEQRVRRLEDALAQLQEAHGLDNRIRERRAGPPATEQPPAPPSVSPSSAALLMDAGKRLLGAAADAVMQQAVAPPPQPAGSAPRLGLIADILAQLRAALRMYVDPRYKQSWLGRVLLPILLAAICLSSYWVPGANIPLVTKGVDLLLAYVFFKVLGREARRYREMSPDLPPTLRL